jgi:nucleotide-binding universal stress UspA family protein
MVSYERVLVPTDGNDDAATTVEHALSLAAPGAEIHALYVVDKTLLYAAGDDGETAETLRGEGEEAVATVADAAADAGFEAITALREGTPPREILAYVEEEGVDAVVMGTRGRTGTERVVKMGSTTERVIEEATAPVLAVRVS